MLEYKGYHASVKYDADDNILVGEVFGITDSLNFHGTSIKELEKCFTIVLIIILNYVKNRENTRKGI